MNVFSTNSLEINTPFSGVKSLELFALIILIIVILIPYL